MKQLAQINKSCSIHHLLWLACAYTLTWEGPCGRALAEKPLSVGVLASVGFFLSSCSITSFFARCTIGSFALRQGIQEAQLVATRAEDFEVVRGCYNKWWQLCARLSRMDVAAVAVFATFCVFWGFLSSLTGGILVGQAMGGSSWTALLRTCCFLGYSVYGLYGCGFILLSAGDIQDTFQEAFLVIVRRHATRRFRTSDGTDPRDYFLLCTEKGLLDRQPLGYTILGVAITKRLVFRTSYLIIYTTVLNMLRVAFRA